MYKVRVGRNAQKKLIMISEPFYTKIKIAILDLGKESRPQS
jgi:mRNA interferase RelE/StbE